MRLIIDLSLKKSRIGEPEPTLLNKPAYGAKDTYKNMRT